LSGALVLVVLGSLPLIVWNWRRAVEQERIAAGRLEETQQERNRAVEQERIAAKRLEETQQERNRADEAFKLAQGALKDTQQERDRADEGYGLARTAIADVFRLLEEDRWDEVPGSEQAKKQLLENGLKYYRMFVARHRDDSKLKREVAHALFQTGMIATRIGPKRDAVESFQTSVALLRSLIKDHPDDIAMRKLLGRVLVNLGNALNALNRLEEAVAAHEEAIGVWAQLQKERPGGSEADKEQVIGWLNRGVALQASEDWPRALESFRRGRAMLTERGLAAKEPRLMVLLLLNISQAEDHLGQLDDAIRDAREAGKFAEQMLKATPRAEEARLMTAYAARMMGNLSRKKGDYEAAKTHLQLAQKSLDELHQERPRLTEYTWNLSLVYEDLAALAESQKQPLDAIKALERAESLMKELVERDAESHPNRLSLARIERRLAKFHQDQGNLEATRKAYELAKIHLEYLLDHNSPKSTVRAELAGVCHQLGVAFAKLQKHKEAAANAEEAAKHYRVLLDRAPNDGRARKNLSSVLGNNAIARRALRRLPEALRATEERVRLWPDNQVELYDAATDFARTYELAAKASEPTLKVRDDALKNTVGALRQAIRAGFADHEKLRTDARFATLRETPEFQTLLKELAGMRP
jgi:tetratricopeptide (TPR) repeat protein